MLPAFSISGTIFCMVTEELIAEEATDQWQGCDQCSAKALIEVVLPFGDLTFCMHHYNKNAVALTDQGGIARLLHSKENG